MPSPRHVRATTLVRLRGVPYDAGTVFAVSPRPDASASAPVEVDAVTAGRWLDEKWAAPVAGDVPAERAKAK